MQRGRRQKMGTSSLQTDSLLQSRKKRSFSLPSFKRSWAGERQVEVAARSEEKMAARSAEEEAARVQKAAAWQWYARGVGELAVLPSKRTPNVLLQKKPLAESPRAASRFKADARSARPTASAGAQPTAPSSAPSTPLYDELELSGLRTQMADFVQRLQLHQQTKENQQSPAQKSNTQQSAVDGRPRPVSTDQQHTKAPPPPSAPISSDHQLPKPPPFAPVSSTIAFHKRPFSALHRLFRKVVSGSSKNSPLIINSSPAVYEAEVLPDEEDKNHITPYHYHHYIHHHHHHYHYGQSPEESAADIIFRNRRRHSDSSGIHPHLPSLLEAESEEEGEDLERSPIEAYLARRRRHSYNFAGHLTPQKAAVDEEEEMKGQSAKEALLLQLPRRYNSERFSPNKIPTMASKDLAKPAKIEFDEGFLEIRSRRRHSAEGASLERKAEGGEKSGGVGTYRLGGAADGATPVKPLVRRRHSESLQRPEAKGVYYETRYLEDVLQRHTGASAPAPAAVPAPACRPRELPPIYPK